MLRYVYLNKINLSLISYFILIHIVICKKIIIFAIEKYTFI